jgi:uncharacterized protein with PIN domain
LLEKPRFLVDAMLGSLARRLRLLGFDAAYTISSDDELIGKALRENRIIITMDTELATSRSARRAGVILLKSDLNQLSAQLEFVLKELIRKGLWFEKNEPRCSLCNLKLIPVKKASIAGTVPSYVF